MKLRELCKIKHGFAFKGKDIIKEHSTKYVLVTPGNFNIGGGFKADKCKYFSENAEISQEYILKENDLIVTMTDLSVKSDTLGYSAIIPYDENSIYLHNQRIGLVYDIDENKIIKDYLYWFMRTRKYHQKIVASQSGTSIHHTSPDRILDIDIKLPSIKEQKKVVEILFNIENKIKLNNQINNNLLQLCRYKYDELNNNYDNWDLIKINDLNLEVTDYVANGSFKSLADNVTLYDEKEYALYVRNTDLKVNFSDKRKYVDEKSYNFLRKSKLNGGELIISNVGDVGSVFICPCLDMPMTLGSNVIMLYSTDEHYYNYFLYFFFCSNYGQHMINGITGGSAQPKFNKTDFRNMEIKFPTLEELDKFNKDIEPIYRKYELNIKENEKIAQLRDTLLPKLMNGEIDLDNIEI